MRDFTQLKNRMLGRLKGSSWGSYRSNHLFAVGKSNPGPACIHSLKPQPSAVSRDSKCVYGQHVCLASFMQPWTRLQFSSVKHQTSYQVLQSVFTLKQQKSQLCKQGNVDSGFAKQNCWQAQALCGTQTLVSATLRPFQPHSASLQTWATNFQAGTGSKIDSCLNPCLPPLIQVLSSSTALACAADTGKACRQACRHSQGLQTQGLQPILRRKEKEKPTLLGAITGASV